MVQHHIKMRTDWRFLLEHLKTMLAKNKHSFSTIDLKNEKRKYFNRTYGSRSIYAHR